MIILTVFSLLTPLVGVAGIGVISILYGFVERNQMNSGQHFFFGIPITVGAIGLHFLIRQWAHHNTLHVWLIEAVIVAFMWFLFQRS